MPLPARAVVLYHYTTEERCREIVSTGLLKPSLRAANPRDARHGDGQYLSDVTPGSRSPGRLARSFLNDPRAWRRFTHYVAIDVSGLVVEPCRPEVFLIRGSTDLDLRDRLVAHGPNT